MPRAKQIAVFTLLVLAAVIFAACKGASGGSSSGSNDPAAAATVWVANGIPVKEELSKNRRTKAARASSPR